MTGNTPNMPPGWHDRVSSVEVLQNGVESFQNPPSTGSTRTLPPGAFNAADLGIAFNDNISSLRVPSDWRVRAYLEPGFIGPEVFFYGSAIGSLGSTFNNAISSLVVEQPVTVFSDALYFGEYQIFWEGLYNFTDMVVPNDSISAIVVPRGFEVQAFEYANFTGTSITFTSSQMTMPEGWNERISSLRVSRVIL